MSEAGAAGGRGPLAVTAPPRPFRIEVAQPTLDHLRARIEGYRHFPPPDDDPDGWSYGVSASWLADLCRYWTDGYDWRAAETDLNRYPQYLVDVDGVRLHYAVVRGESAARRPLLLLHGWPGSVLEFWTIADRLAFPSRHGGSAADAFDLVIPSLPGFGFSGPAARPVGPRTMAALLDTLMADVLGHGRYMVQGGDLGGIVAAWLGADHSEHCAAVHVNMIGWRPTPGDDGAATEAERHAVAAMIDRERPRLAYAVQHGTRPQTLALGLMDSPVGTAAWILDRFQAWSDLGGKDIDAVYTRDELLTNVMIYLVTGTFASSIWAYRGVNAERAQLSARPYCASPTALARFPFEWVGGTPPRSWVERYYNLVRWTEFDSGGHFASLERPDDLVGDVRAFGRDHFAATPSATAGRPRPDIERTDT
jgi:pimeloyl-ACP methyl ester carboxylesterase